MRYAEEDGRTPSTPPCVRSQQWPRISFAKHALLICPHRWTKEEIRAGLKRFCAPYARNLCTLAETKTIYRDVRATTELSEPTFYDYL